MFTSRLFSSTIGMLGSLIVGRWGAAEQLRIIKRWCTQKPFGEAKDQLLFCTGIDENFFNFLMPSGAGEL